MNLGDLINVLTTGFTNWTTQIIVAIIIFLIGAIIARVVKRIVYHALHELEFNTVLERLTKRKIKSEERLSQAIAYFIYAIAVIFALNQIGVTTALLYILLGFFLIIIVFIFFLGVKDFIPNVIAGLRISKQNLLKVGDHVKIGKIEGKIDKINLLELHINTQKNDLIVIPNQTVLKETIVKIKS